MTVGPIDCGGGPWGHDDIRASAASTALDALGNTFGLTPFDGRLLLGPTVLDGARGPFFCAGGVVGLAYGKSGRERGLGTFSSC